MRNNKIKILLKKNEQFMNIMMKKMMINEIIIKNRWVKF